METNTKDRNNWVDILKALGMFAIILGHFADNAGPAYFYVFTYHVPLFFFAAGFFAVPTNAISMLQYVKRKIQTILVPYFIFSALVIIVSAVNQRLLLSDIKLLIIEMFFGIRNRVPGGSLWFLTAIFTMSILYFLLYKIFKNKVVLLTISIFMFYFYHSEIFTVLVPNKPAWIFNLDSVFLYLVYYVCGHLL